MRKFWKSAQNCLKWLTIWSDKFSIFVLSLWVGAVEASCQDENCQCATKCVCFCLHALSLPISKSLFFWHDSQSNFTLLTVLYCTASFETWYLIELTYFGCHLIFHQDLLPDMQKYFTVLAKLTFTLTEVIIRLSLSQRLLLDFHSNWGYYQTFTSTALRISLSLRLLFDFHSHWGYYKTLILTEALIRLSLKTEVHITLSLTVWLLLD